MIIELVLFFVSRVESSQMKRTRLVMCTFELDTDRALAARLMFLRTKVEGQMMQDSDDAVNQNHLLLVLHDIIWYY